MGFFWQGLVMRDVGDFTVGMDEDSVIGMDEDVLFSEEAPKLA